MDGSGLISQMRNLRTLRNFFTKEVQNFTLPVMLYIEGKESFPEMIVQIDLKTFILGKKERGKEEKSRSFLFLLFSRDSAREESEEK